MSKVQYLYLSITVLLFSSCGQNLPEPKKPEEPPTVSTLPPFPLRQGDELEFIIGGRVIDGEISRERVLNAKFVVQSVALDQKSKHWTVKASNQYSNEVDEAGAMEIAPLFASHIVPFASVSAEAPLLGEKKYVTDVAITDALEIVEEQFPFFDFDPEAGHSEGAVFSQAASAFRARILRLDAEAKIFVQASSYRLEAHFVDKRFAEPYLHEFKILVSPFGFIAKIEERMTKWKDGMERNASSLASADIAAVFPSPVKVKRDGIVYVWSPLTGKLRATSGNDLCLSRNPNKAPGPCL